MARAKAVGEFETIERLARVFAARGAAGVKVGIGDDAAVLRLRGEVAWTIDTSVEGVHFERQWLTLGQLGFRSLQAAASDICAMGGRPRFALSSLIVPAKTTPRELVELGRGQERAARELGCAVIGGNISRGDVLSVTTSVLGDSAGLERSAARAGDELWLLGDVGLSALGLELLRRGKRRAQTLHERAALRAFREPRARAREGRGLVGRARAAIDVSDGLAGDARHVARASGVRVLIDTVALRAALPKALLTLAPRLKLDPLALALYGGEDYALLACGPAGRMPRAARPIGRISAGSGVWLMEGDRLERAGHGFEHF